MVINEDNYNLIEKVTDITHTDYGIKWTDAENIKGTLDDYGIQCMLEDLIDEIECQKENYEELRKDLLENYRPIYRNPYEYGE